MAIGPSLYLTDEEIAELIGVGLEKWRANVKAFQGRFRDFPKRDEMFCNRWYWPSVKAFLDRRNGLVGDSPATTSWEENHNGKIVRIEATRPR